MQRVLTVSLNRNAVQVEEEAQIRLAAYLADAGVKLANNPDRAEILFDLEQAVADQCKRRMQPGQTVITLAELAPALDEMGEVEVPDSVPRAEPTAKAAPAAPALQQISQGALISGVMLGLARVANLDVTLVRVVALVLLIFSGGAIVVLYLALMLLLPFAPVDATGPAIRKLPAKCRDWVQWVRAKLAALTG
jgi:phage shock protein PspC (stress-responsive transcriptional regulator)